MQWPGIRKATSFGASRYQNVTVTLIEFMNITSELNSINCTGPLKSEGCLFLNIYTPMGNADCA